MLQFAVARPSRAADRVLALALCAGCVASSHAAETPEFVLQWGGPGAGTGKFVSPRAVAVDSEGRILVPDDSGRLQRFDGQGKLLDEWCGTDEMSRLFTGGAALAARDAIRLGTRLATLDRKLLAAFPEHTEALPHR